MSTLDELLGILNNGIDVSQIVPEIEKKKKRRKKADIDKLSKMFINSIYIPSIDESFAINMVGIAKKPDIDIETIKMPIDSLESIKDIMKNIPGFTSIVHSTHIQDGKYLYCIKTKFDSIDMEYAHYFSGDVLYGIYKFTLYNPVVLTEKELENLIERNFDE